MFSFLRRLLGLSYSKRERGIFRYFDGSKWRRADPFEANRKLEKEGGKDWTSLLAGIRIEKVPFEKLSPGMMRAVADNWHHSIEKLAELARKVFDVKPISDDGGLTDGQALSLLMDFLDWISACEEDFRPLLVLSTPEPLASGDSTTAPSAASSSTEDTSSANNPTSSKSESSEQSEASILADSEIKVDEWLPSTILKRNSNA